MNISIDINVVRWGTVSPETEEVSGFFEACASLRNLTNDYRKSECRVKEVWDAVKGRQAAPLLYFRCIFS